MHLVPSSFINKLNLTFVFNFVKQLLNKIKVLFNLYPNKKKNKLILMMHKLILICSRVGGGFSPCDTSSNRTCGFPAYGFFFVSSPFPGVSVLFISLSD